MSSGFIHMGRFSLVYRKRFGESPSETHKRAKYQKGRQKSRQRGYAA